MTDRASSGDARRGRRRGLRGVVVLAASLALLAAAPALLSTALLRPLTVRWINARAGVPMQVASLSLSWRSTCVLRDVRVDGPVGFEESPLLTVDEARVGGGWLALLLSAPDSIDVHGAALHLIDGGDTTNLRATIDSWERNRWTVIDTPIELAVSTSTLLLTDRRRGTHARVDAVSASARLTPGSTFDVSFRGDVSSPAGPGRIDLSATRSTSTAAADIRVEGVQLADLQPLWSSIDPAWSAAGMVDLNASVSASDERVAIANDGHLRGLSLIAPPWIPTELRDSSVTLNGAIEFDPVRRELHADGLRIVSMLLGVEADGRLSAGGDHIGGDLSLHVDVDLDRAIPRLPHLARPLLRGAAVAGGLSLDLSPAGPDRFRARLTGQSTSLFLPDVGRADLRDFVLEGVLHATADARRVDLDQLHAGFRFGDVTGRAAVRRSPGAAAEGAIELRYVGDTLLAREQLQGLLEGIDLATAGVIDLRVRAAATADTLQATADLDSESFDVTFVDTGESDYYRFGGEQATVHFDLESPRQHDDPWRAVSADLTVRADRATVRKEPLTHLDFAASLRDGVATVSTCETDHADGGHISATGTLTVAGVTRPRLTVSAQASDLRVARFAVRLAARTTGAFAASPLPQRVSATNRMDIRVGLSAEGAGTSEFLRSMNGELVLSIGPGEITGSPLLDRLIPGERAARSVRSIRSEVTLRPALLESSTVIETDSGRVFHLTGTATLDDRFHYSIPASELIPAELLGSLPAAAPDDAFGVHGEITDPQLRIPDPFPMIEAVRALGWEGALSQMFPDDTDGI